MKLSFERSAWPMGTILRGFPVQAALVRLVFNDRFLRRIFRFHRFGVRSPPVVAPLFFLVSNSSCIFLSLRTVIDSVMFRCFLRWGVESIPSRVLVGDASGI